MILALLSDDKLTPLEEEYFAKLGAKRGWHSN